MRSTRSRSSFRGLAVCGILLGLAGNVLAGTEDLISKLPADANGLISIDVDAVKSSPVARMEGWFDPAKARSEDILFIPRGCKQVAVATQLDGDREVKYGVSLADLAEPVSIGKIATAEGGNKENVGAKEAVRSPGNAYYIQLAESRLATVFPADRQSAARVASGYHKGIASPYLRAAVNDPAPLVMAIDTDGMFSTGELYKRFDSRPIKTIDDANIDVQALAKLVASMKGVTLRVTFGDEAAGTATIDFDSDTALIAKVAKPLVIEVLKRNGLNVVEFSNWNFTASGKQIKGGGKLTAFTLKRLLSLADAPVPVQLDPTSAPPGDDAAADPLKTNAAASLKYYKTYATVLDNVSKAPSLGEQATWMRRDAKRLAALPILNVDPELLDWGQEVADKLNAAANQLSTGQMSVRTASNSIAAPTTPGAIGDGMFYQENKQYSKDMDNYRLQLRATTGGEYERAVQAAAATLNGITPSRNAIRRKMTEKYGVEF